MAPTAAITELVDAARRRLLEGDWDIAIAVTDLPLRLGRQPVVRHVSRTHGIAVVSLPALGAIHLGRRLRRTLVELVRSLVGDDREDEGASGAAGGRGRLRRRWRRGVLRELAGEPAATVGGLAFVYVPALVFGHLRLLLGMVRANRPWHFAVRLYRVLVAAFAAGAYGVVTSDIWRISAALGWARLSLLAVLSVATTIVAVIAAHELWERAPNPRVRGQVALFNITTTLTVTIGIVTLYAALFALIFVGAELILSPRVLETALGEEVGTRTYTVLAWLIASLATVGGALGAGLESDDAVRQAAYTAPPPDGRTRVGA